MWFRIVTNSRNYYRSQHTECHHYLVSRGKVCFAVTNIIIIELDF